MDLPAMGKFMAGNNNTRLFSHAPTPIAILQGRDMRYEFINAAYAAMVNQRQILGKPIREAFPELHGQGFFQILENVFDTGIPFYGYEVPALVDYHNDGHFTTRYYNLVYTPFTNDEGSIEGIMAFGNDVTEHVLSKKLLAYSENSFRNMVLQAPVAMCVLKGKDHVVEVANDPMYTIWGNGPDKVLGRPLFEGLPESRGQGLELLLDSILITGERFIASERPVQLPRNGKIGTVYLNFVYEALRDGNGIIAGIIAVATDVTEQVISRQRVEHAMESARLAIESADLGTYEINLLTNELFPSARFNAIWGVKEATTDRSIFVAAIHPDDLEARRQAHQRALTAGHLHYEARVIWKDGSQRWVKVKGKVLSDVHGTPVRLLGVIQDITEQKNFAWELSRQVEERTKALKEANEQLARSNEDLEQFAFVASHDLQEPLRKIQLYNNMGRDRPDIPQDMKGYLEKVHAAAERMTGLIRDLLEYSRLSQSRSRFEKTDLNAIVKAVLNDYELMIMQKQAIVEIAELPVLPAIPLQMNQLFFNLIGNALKFSKKDSVPVITIRAEKLTEETINAFPQLNTRQCYYQICIRDNGIGFAQEYGDKIFTIFQRLNERSQFGGYGIGLALCRKIISNHGGVIYAEGVPKKGASFIFILPYSI